MPGATGARSLGPQSGGEEPPEGRENDPLLEGGAKS